MNGVEITRPTIIYALVNANREHTSHIEYIG